MVSVRLNLSQYYEPDLPSQSPFCKVGTDFIQAFFNVMLKNFGVKGVKVQEVVSLDEELLSCIP